ncbi:uncharacterized protein LOC144713604 [Wolffia australiana]
MDRGFVCFFLFLSLLFSGGRAAVTFNDILNLALPTSNPKTETAISHPSKLVNGEEVGDHSKTSVDFGTRGWPFLYYTRRDGKGTVDWGTLAWPYIYYSKKDGKDDVADTAIVAAESTGGRKGGAGFKV